MVRRYLSHEIKDAILCNDRLACQKSLYYGMLVNFECLSLIWIEEYVKNIYASEAEVTFFRRSCGLNATF